jgi:hypothetical protein
VPPRFLSEGKLCLTIDPFGSDYRWPETLLPGPPGAAQCSDAARANVTRLVKQVCAGISSQPAMPRLRTACVLHFLPSFSLATLLYFSSAADEETVYADIFFANRILDRSCRCIHRDFIPPFVVRSLKTPHRSAVAHLRL